MIDLDKLEKLAKSATPGPWYVEGPFTDEESSTPGGVGAQLFAYSEECDESELLVDAFESRKDEKDAEYIAALSPDVVLELIAEVRTHRDQLAEAREVISFYAEPFTWARVSADARHVGAISDFNFNNMYGEKARAYLEKYKC